MEKRYNDPELWQQGIESAVGSLEPILQQYKAWYWQQFDLMSNTDKEQLRWVYQAMEVALSDSLYECERKLWSQKDGNH